MKLDYSVVSKPKERPARDKVIIWADKHNWPNPMVAKFPSTWKENDIQTYKQEYLTRKA